MREVMAMSAMSTESTCLNNGAGYRLIRQEHYADVLAWLDDVHGVATSPPLADDEV